MAKEFYRAHRFGEEALLRLTQVNSIVDRYQKGGLRLTLRQLYYQLVSANVIPCTQGQSSWEVDALPPEVLQALIESAIAQECDRQLMDAQIAQEERDKGRLRQAARRL